MSTSTSTNNKQHRFSFEGGDVLSKMGATWFVSYAYHIRKDGKHKNWNNINKNDLKIRIGRFMPSTLYHRFWLCKIRNMDDARLNSKKIGLKATQVKQMAHELLDMFW